jgi:beta-alanine degradation protein BauB
MKERRLMPFDAERSLDEWRKAWGSSPQVGSIATEVLLENDLIRVWDLTLEPGETSPLHTHQHPYFFVPLEPAELRARFADGTASDDDDPRGTPVWAGLDGLRRTHTVTNIADHRYVGRVIEILTAEIPNDE